MGDDRAVQLPGFEHEVKLSVYWSELERAAVAPTTYSLRVALGKRSTEAIPGVQAAIQRTSVREGILRDATLNTALIREMLQGDGAPKQKQFSVAEGMPAHKQRKEITT